MPDMLADYLLYVIYIMLLLVTASTTLVARMVSFAEPLTSLACFVGFSPPILTDANCGHYAKLVRATNTNQLLAR